MDQHPIPRQITTFEFKLIGFMTLKQFIYLAMAFPIAYIVFALFPIPVLNILLAALVAFAGIAFAFIPIMDRPLDVWIKNLYKRLQSPTQYFYQKKNEPLYFLKDLYFLADPHHMLAHIESKEKLAQYLAATRQRQRPDYRKKQIGTLMQTSTDALQNQPALAAAPAPPVAPPQVAPVAPVAQVVAAPDATHAAVIQVPHAPDFSKEEVTTSSDSTQADAPGAADTMPSDVTTVGSSTEPAVAPSASQNPIPATNPIPAPNPVQVPTPVAPQAWKMIAEPAVVPAAASPAPVVQPQVIPPVAQTVTPSSVTAPVTATPSYQPQYQTAGDVVTAMPPRQPLMQTQVIAPKPAPPVPVVEPPTQPFLTGIVKTGKRIPLPGVMVYMKDPSGNPVRLMKSNPHGVFATYNPVSPGSYVLEIKDPNGMYFFDTMNISVKETNPLPVEIMSKEIL